MPKLFTKFKYLKPSDRNSIGNYAKYIATREGVDKIDDTQKFAPATKNQKIFIQKMLADFPDAKESLEYNDYIKHPNRGNASEFISRTLEDNEFEISNSKTYADYIATRPRAERIGSHGLFTDDKIEVNLTDVSNTLNNHKGNVWTMIVSLRREDAERLGFNIGERWRTMLRGQTAQLSECLNIPINNLHWYAAFHNESHHPHIHLIAYSDIDNEGRINKNRIMKMRSSLAKSIFEQDLVSVYEKQTSNRNEIKRTSNEIIKKIISRINTGIYDNPQIEGLLLKLSDKLSRTSGRKQYGYLKADVKNIVDAIVDLLEKDERISSLYNLWYEKKFEIIRTYTDELPDKIPLSKNNEFKSIKNMIISEAMSINADVIVTDEGDNVADEGIEPTEDEYEEVEPPTYSFEYLELLDKAKKGNKWNQYGLAKYLLDKDNAEYNPNEAVKWLLKSAMQDYSVAQYKLGRLFLEGKEVKKDVDYAIKWLEKGVEEHNMYAQYLLGKTYLKGEDVPKDIPKAVDLLLSSAEQGNKYAQYTIGKLFLEGEIVEKDLHNGYHFLYESAMKDFAPAQYYLGKINYRGTDIPKDIDEAVYYLKKASIAGNPYAAYLMGRIYSTETKYKYLPSAIIFFKYAAECGNSFANYQLGKIYYYGDYGVDKNIDLAIEYLKTSAEQGNQYAEQMLYSIQKHKNTFITSSSLRLLQSVASLITKKAQAEEKKKKITQATEKKEMQKINEKKQAHGLKPTM
jgi:hypothetical protein